MVRKTVCGLPLTALASATRSVAGAGVPARFTNVRWANTASRRICHSRHSPRLVCRRISTRGCSSLAVLLRSHCLSGATGVPPIASWRGGRATSSPLAVGCIGTQRRHGARGSASGTGSMVRRLSCPPSHSSRRPPLVVRIRHGSCCRTRRQRRGQSEALAAARHRPRGVRLGVERNLSTHAGAAFRVFMARSVSRATRYFA